MNKSIVYIETVYSEKSELSIDYLLGVYSNRSLLQEKVRNLLDTFFTKEKITGKIILIKPNWVRHSLRTSDDYCLCTNENLILETVIYLLERNVGQLILADAPIQGCDWSRVLSKRFIDEIQSLSIKYEIPIQIKDFRRTILDPSKNKISKERLSLEDFVLFDLGEKSFLEPISDTRHRFRVTCYNPDRLAISHSKGVHKYCIAKDVFDSDIILTMPKMKTHQKAGITNAMKILVGINGDKDFLPHHRIGAKGYGGDCYPGKNWLRSTSEWFLDQANRHIGSALYRPLSLLSSLCWQLSNSSPEQNLGAAWYGNDTVWRMVMDLNQIAMFGRSDGSISIEPQRQIYSLCDGIIGGEGNGPLHPDPLPLGVLTFSNNSYWMDLIMGNLFSLEIENIPNLKAARELLDLSNCELAINGKVSTLEDIRNLSVPVRMAPGWLNYNKINK